MQDEADPPHAPQPVQQPVPQPAEQAVPTHAQKSAEHEPAEPADNAVEAAADENTGGPADDENAGEPADDAVEAAADENAGEADPEPVDLGPGHLRFVAEGEMWLFTDGVPRVVTTPVEVDFENWKCKRKQNYSEYNSARQRKRLKQEQRKSRVSATAEYDDDTSAQERMADQFDDWFRGLRTLTSKTVLKDLMNGGRRFFRSPTLKVLSINAFIRMFEGALNKVHYNRCLTKDYRSASVCAQRFLHISHICQDTQFRTSATSWISRNAPVVLAALKDTTRAADFEDTFA